LMVAHLLRFSPPLIRIRELIKSGELGFIVSARAEYMYDARFSQRRWLQNIQTAGGGSTFDIGVHCLDTLRFILDDDVVAVKSQLVPEPTRTTTEQTSFVLLKFSRGTPASIYTSFISPIRRAFLEVIGQDGILSIENFAMNTMTISLKRTTGTNGSTADIIQESFEVPGLCEKEVTAFSASLLKNTPVPIPGEEGLKNQRILDLIMKL
jgi:1,5-anhydro-D-fructose reductase (1,5-anhydro-D-mannitol-forming)